MLFLSLCVTLVSLASAGTPLPDTSAECLSCQEGVASMVNIWTNETTVAEILVELQDGCKSYPLVKRQVCDKLAEVFVQIPPSLYDGMYDLAWPIPEAICATTGECSVNCCAPNDPAEQVHLSVASKDHTVMGVSWTTLNQRDSIVEYGYAPNFLTSSETGSFVAFTEETKYSYFNFTSNWIGTFHTAKMTNLKPGVTYYYRVGNGELWSKVFHFTNPNPFKESFTYVFLGDMDYAENSDATVASVQRMVDANEVDAVVHSGDLSYADGYEPHFDAFFNKIEPIASRVPYMGSPGNHEFWYNFTSYKNRLYMPGVIDEGGSGDNMFFSWNLGPVHFLSCNSETPVDTANFDPVQIEWMARDLRQVHRKVTPWVVANFHRPMYCAGDSDSTCGRQAGVLKKEAEGIFFRNEVNAVITGHVHAYERTFPVYKEEKMSDEYTAVPYAGPVHLMQGASGNREGNKGSYPPEDERPAWSAAMRNEVGYGVMVVTETEMKWTFYRSQLEGPDEVLDSVVITREQ